jgi:hypothetical protein
VLNIARGLAYLFASEQKQDSCLFLVMRRSKPNAQRLGKSHACSELTILQAFTKMSTATLDVRDQTKLDDSVRTTDVAGSES